MTTSVLRLTVALVGGVVVPGGDSPQPVRPGPLLLASTADALPSSYHLAVSAVPEPPMFEVAPRAPTCPFEVRAVVRGDGRDSTFAILATSTGSDLVYAGSRLRASGAELVVHAITASGVDLRQGDAVIRCDLARGDR